jgi:hypothetical protein
MSTWRKSSAVGSDPSLSSSGPSKAGSVVPRLGIVVLAELGEAHVAHPKDHGADASALRTVGHDQ